MPENGSEIHFKDTNWLYLRYSQTLQDTDSGQFPFRSQSAEKGLLMKVVALSQLLVRVPVT